MDARRILMRATRRPADRIVARGTRRGLRRGMTLIEVMMAVTILATALIGLGNFMGTFSHATKVASLQQRAIDLATDRIDSVKRAPTFVSIDTMAVVETIRVDSANYRRETLVRHVGGGPTDTLDYRTVTVAVTAPSVTTPIRKTTIISSY